MNSYLIQLNAIFGSFYPLIFISTIYFALTLLTWVTSENLPLPWGCIWRPELWKNLSSLIFLSIIHLNPSIQKKVQSVFWSVLLLSFFSPLFFFLPLWCFSSSSFQHLTYLISLLVRCYRLNIKCTQGLMCHMVLFQKLVEIWGGEASLKKTDH